MMKKILLGTTAIVGASVAFSTAAIAADPPALSLSGVVKFETFFLDQDDLAVGGAQNRGYSFDVDDAEVVFKASATADNGLKYGAKIEYEFENNGTDEAMIWLEGNWGLVNLGNEDGAEDLMKLGGYSILSGQGGWDGGAPFNTPTTSWAAGSLTGPAMAHDSSDANKITYFTPSFSGFRAGVSWTPDTGSNLEASTIADNGTNAENHGTIAAEYKGNFNDVSVQFAGSYGFAGYESNNLTNSTSERNDLSAWAIGAKVGFSGFQLAAGYGDNRDSGVTKSNDAAGQDAGKFYDVALSYSTGPYTVAGGYFHAETGNVSGLGDDETDWFSIGGNYNAAPGLDFYTEYNHIKMDAAGNVANDSNDANVFMVGTKVSF